MASRRPISVRLKRSMDVVVSGTALLALSPVAVAVAIMVKVRLGSPVLFKQVRAGRDENEIRVAKFRSMTDATDDSGELLADDERLTSFGAMLRRTSLDELPQLWSILVGDMSLVGPRPLPTTYVSRYSTHQLRRLEVPPGLTGWAQVHGRNAVDWPERLDLDVWYVDNFSLWLDMKILARTARIVLTGAGVSATGQATMSEFRGDESR